MHIYRNENLRITRNLNTFSKQINYQNLLFYLFEQNNFIDKII